MHAQMEVALREGAKQRMRARTLCVDRRSNLALTQSLDRLALDEVLASDPGIGRRDVRQVSKPVLMPSKRDFRDTLKADVLSAGWDVSNVP